MYCKYKWTYYFFVLILCGMLFGCSKYPVGPETVDSFGGGRFQILALDTVTPGINVWELMDLEKGTIESAVYIYSEHDSTLCILGSEGYTAIDIETGDYKQSENVRDFEKKDAEIFDTLESQMERFIKDNKIEPPQPDSAFSTD